MEANVKTISEEEINDVDYIIVILDADALAFQNDLSKPYFSIPVPTRWEENKGSFSSYIKERARRMTWAAERILLSPIESSGNVGILNRSSNFYLSYELEHVYQMWMYEEDFPIPKGLIDEVNYSVDYQWYVYPEILPWCLGDVLEV